MRYIYVLIAKAVVLAQEGLESMRQCLVRNGIDRTQILTKNETMYDEGNFQWNLRTAIESVNYVLVTSAANIQIAVRCSKKTNVPIAARGGGHSYENYSILDSTHFVIDLRKLKEYQFDKLTKTVTVGAGFLLGEIYYKLWIEGKYSIPAGTCPSVGIGGHALGGGYGLSARKFGMLSDQITEMEFVSANGELITVNADSHSDLFFALRGAGSGSFGIVTKFSFKVFDASSDLIKLHLKYESKDFKSVISAWQSWAASSIPHSTTATLLISFSGEIYFNAVIQDKDLNSARIVANSIIEAFPNNYEENNIVTMNFIDMIITFGDTKYAPNITALSTLTRKSMDQFYFKAKSSYLTRSLSESQLKKLEDAFFSASDGGYMLMDIQGGAISDIKENETAFYHRKNNLFSIQMVNAAINLHNYQAKEPWLKKLASLVDKFSSGHGYQNYIDSNHPGDLTYYYGTNLKRLVGIKNHYDPTNMFRGPKTIPLSLNTTFK